MKLVNETLYTIEIENRLGEKHTFHIDLSDLIQVNALAELFKSYDKFEGLSDLNATDPTEMFNELKKLADWQNKINELYDLALGEGACEKIFAGNNSLFTQRTVTQFLINELDKAKIKIDDYVSSVRKEMLVSDHKRSDTI